METSNNTYQDIKELPEGVYALGVNAFYRAGSNSSTAIENWLAHNAASKYAKLYSVAGGINRETAIANVFSGAQEENQNVGDVAVTYTDPESSDEKTVYVPNNMGLFIVDEVSLIGSGSSQEGSLFGSGDLLADLVAFVRAGTDCKLVLLGDDAQLPPVGLDASPALSPDYMAQFGGVLFVSLTEVVRQASESGILMNATHLRQLLPYSDGGALGLSVAGFPDISRLSGGELLDTLSDAYARYGEDEVVVLCRSNKRAGRYNAGIRGQVLYREEQLTRGEKLMVVKNHYLDGRTELEGTDYIANGDIGTLVWIKHFEERYGLHFADACLAFPDYGNQEVEMKVLLDTLTADSPALSYEQSQALWAGVWADYDHITSKRKRYDAVRSDPFCSALQIKYAHAITTHKAQGGQWQCVFIDNPFWQEDLTADDVKWLYTALTRAVSRVYLVNFPDWVFA